MKNVKIGIIGVGMVGTPLARWLFEIKGYQRGKDLFCFDKNIKKYSDNISSAKIIFICVPTPSNEDGSCDISIVESVISQFAGSEKIVVLKSTVPPGTCEMLSRKYKINFFLFNPEYLTEASALEDFSWPDRQIVAPVNKESEEFCTLLLDLLPSAAFEFCKASSTEAEMAKYGGNVFGAIKVAFANIWADFCEVLGVDYENVRKIISNDCRIGHSWMDVWHGAYRGFGGFCFPKDLKALIAFAKILSEKSDGDGMEILKQKRLLQKGINVLEAIWDYNEYLLFTQGLSVKEVSVHDSELKIKLKKSGREKK